MSLLCAQSFPRDESQDLTGPGQRAAFLNQTLWPVFTTIKIYFFDLPTGAELSQMKWQNPMVPVEFLDPLYATLQNKADPFQLVKTVVQERFAPLVSLSFAFTTNIDESDIRIVFGPQYGWSSIVGNTRFIPADQRREPTMTYGWFDVATVIHEFCHALGMIHEHQNPMDNPIMWNQEAVFCYYRVTQGWDIEKIKQNVIDAYTLDQTNGSKYDDRSIMIYPFPKNLSCTLCKPLNDADNSRCNSRMLPTTLNGMEVRPVYKMSPTDEKWLQIMYPKDGKRDMTQIRSVSGDLEPGGTGPAPPPIRQDVASQPDNAFTQFIEQHWKTIVGVLILVFVLYSFVR